MILQCYGNTEDITVHTGGHDLNSTAPDSMKINKGDGRREKARLIHIVVDTDPRVKLVAKKMEIDAQIKALRKMK